MSEKTLKCNNIILNKKKIQKSKEPIDLLSVDVDQIVVSYKFKHNDEGFKYFFGYSEGEIVKPLGIILSQMDGYIKYIENGSKNISFLIKNDEVWNKYDKIWDGIKDKLGIKFHSESVYEYKCLKAKVREFDGAIRTNFLNNGMPKENMHYTCIACITIDSVLTIDKKIYPQVYLEECKYRIKTVQMPKFIKNELKSNLDLDSVLDSDSDLDLDDTELMAKLKKFDIDSDLDPDLDSEVESKSDAKLMANKKKFNPDSKKIK